MLLKYSILLWLFFWFSQIILAQPSHGDTDNAEVIPISIRGLATHKFNSDSPYESVLKLDVHGSLKLMKQSPGKKIYVARLIEISWYEKTTWYRSPKAKCKVNFDYSHNGHIMASHPQGSTNPYEEVNVTGTHAGPPFSVWLETRQRPDGGRHIRFFMSGPAGIPFEISNYDNRPPCDVDSVSSQTANFRIHLDTVETAEEAKYGGNYTGFINKPMDSGGFLTDEAWQMALGTAPKDVPNMNITWRWGPPITIERKVNGGWVDMGVAIPTVDVGERIVLQGSPPGGTWEITEGIAIERFTASLVEGKVEEPTLNENKLNIVWVSVNDDNPVGTVKYKNTIAGEPVSAEASFSIYRPNIEVDVTTKPILLGKLRVPVTEENLAACDGCLCCEFEGIPESTLITPKVEEIIGIQYPIKFSTDTMSYDKNGEIQWVQIVNKWVSTDQVFEWSDERKDLVWRTTLDNAYLDSLDSCYPYSRAHVTSDAPGAVFGLENLCITDMALMAKVDSAADFSMFLMFRPYGEKNEWVPMKRINWGYEFAAECQLSGRPYWRLTHSKEVPDNPMAQEEYEYPEWNKFMCGGSIEE